MPAPEHAFHHNLSYRLSMLHFLIGRRIAEAYGAEGLTTHQWKVLSVVCEFAPLAASEVERWVTLDKSAISRAVKSLVEKKLITRRVSAADGRTIDLLPTASGRTRNARIAQQVSQLQDALLERLPKRDTERLFAALDQLEQELRLD
ncbi:winged helix-turn-helix transcriptional regulator [Ramlibacter sp. AW1]|uniref:Winged helix-turn-helix transcriptional regulator n=1 Tax=Ramlibacter aurantiacus TaxID=2801330 RepID=A0A936ZQT4_9BURK|nr:MarR family winged helix-turn-helix transcriptional regulator [Ramlibacter aurantiacus]MBL0419325.1 winged helix-turn-helix transcriptional regulator [Ramlibacter aurantiacus]